MHWLSWFKTETFCFVFSLQSGAVVSIMILTALGITSLINIIYFLITTSSFIDNIVPFCLAMAYLIILAVGLVFAFAGAYSESTFWVLMGSLFTGIAILIYLILAALSFIPSMYSTTCFALRCPEHLWLQPSYWRNPEKEVDSGASKGNETRRGDEELMEPLKASMFSIISSTTLLSHRRMKPNCLTRTYTVEKGSHLVEGKGDKDVNLSEMSKRKLANDKGDDEDLEYCPEEREAEESDSGIRIYSIVISILYLALFLVFQLYCLYGFLCFANELRKEVGY